MALPDASLIRLRGFRDPWPAPEPEWPDPPWVMEGRVVTAWSRIDRVRVERIMSPDLLPAPALEPVAMRVRLYDVRFTPSEGGSRGCGGSFREAVIACGSSVGGISGEASLFMWTDSDTYMTWGREVFGWPLRRGEFSFSGSLWEADALPREPSDTAAISGSGEARFSDGQLAIDIHAIRPTAGGVRSASWITPRRILRSAGCAPEEREVLIVRPQILAPGMRYEASGEVRLSFRRGHLLADLAVPTDSFEVIDGFRVVVGTQVEAIAESELNGSHSDG